MSEVDRRSRGRSLVEIAQEEIKTNKMRWKYNEKVGVHRYTSPDQFKSYLESDQPA